MTEEEELLKIKEEYGEQFAEHCEEFLKPLLGKEGELYKILKSTIADNAKNIYTDISQSQIEFKWNDTIMYQSTSLDRKNELHNVIYCKFNPELLDKKELSLWKSYNEKPKQIKMPGYTLANDGKYYKYNMEIDGVYYCPGNIVIENGEACDLEKTGKQVLIDCFVVDMENNTVKPYDSKIKDSFVDGLQNISSIERIQNDEKEKIIIQKEGQNEPIIIEINNNQISGYENKELTEVGDNFLKKNKALKNLNLPQVKQVGNSFLLYNKDMAGLDMPELVQTGNSFLSNNREIEELNVPNLKQVGSHFLNNNNKLVKLDVPNLEQVGDYCLDENKSINEVNAPNLREIGRAFLYKNTSLTELEMPNLTYVGDVFLWNNKTINKVNMPNLKRVGNDFLSANESLTEVEMLSLTHTGDDFLRCNKCITKLEAPNLRVAGDRFLEFAERIEKLELPNLVYAGSYVLCNAHSLEELKVPNLKEVSSYFLTQNHGITELQLPNLIKAREGFMPFNRNLTKFEAPNLPELSEKFARIIERNTGKSITPKNIAELDQKNELTTSELSWGSRMMDKIKSMFKDFKDKDREEK